MANFKKRISYTPFIFIIGLINVFDVYLSIIYADFIFFNEQNALSRFLIRECGIYYFVALKSFTTIIVMLVCWSLTKTKYRIAILWVFFFQAMLFLYLNFYAEEVNDDLDLTPLDHIIQGVEIDSGHEFF